MHGYQKQQEGEEQRGQETYKIEGGCFLVGGCLMDRGGDFPSFEPRLPDRLQNTVRRELFRVPVEHQNLGCKVDVNGGCPGQVLNGPFHR